MFSFKIPFSFLVFLLGINSCTAQQSGAVFYEGLRNNLDGHQAEAIICFEKALDAANPHIASAAAAELMSMRYTGVELSEAAITGIRQKASGSWAQAIGAVDQGGVIDREKFLALLLHGESRSFDEAAHYALQKWLSGRDNDSPGSDVLTEAEAAAIHGRLAVSRSRYNEAMIFFRAVVRDSPELFFRYPDLLADLGRSYQYAATGREGINLFLDWEKTFSGGENDDNESLIRFRLLFFAARISRQRGEQNIALFEQALPFVPENSPEQADACIWYILDSALAQGSETAIRYMEKYIHQWHDDAYFTDILDILARELVHKRQWKDLLTVSALLRDRPGTASAHYAWILSRVIEEGYLPPEESAEAYMRIAYDAGDSIWYYRSRSAKALGEPFLALPVMTQEPEAATQAASEQPTPVMQFLLGFFEHNAAPFASRYIKVQENDLSVDELRSLAGNLDAAGQYQESMRLVSLYSRKSGYRIERRDLELWYPRPFKELVEQYAEETGIEPAVLYGLIRTESAFDSNIVSRAGAVGLTQLMPATAQETAARIHRRGGPDYTRHDAAENVSEDSALDLRNPAVNIHIGAAYLAYLNERMEDPLLALLAYNGGINRIRRWLRAAGSASGTLPPDLFLETIEYPETRNYGRRVMGAAAMYKELYY